ncbi:hypothetical protein B1526_1645 [Bifidobacterium criceti]|uniref:Uncharacterized protein n=1 Tax=Bifidobacterium criceti TaxID=1960969 RepID=A0A2A2EC18_9BIFI|nr:hypothetical protein B1526_1645 [Bifidobacterium criceti]
MHDQWESTIVALDRLMTEVENAATASAFEQQ